MLIRPLYCPSFCLAQANLHALIQLKPALSHLGDKGLLLLLRCVLLYILHGPHFCCSTGYSDCCFCCLGSCPFLKVSLTSMRGVMSANRWRNGTRYIHGSYILNVEVNHTFEDFFSSRYFFHNFIIFL